MIHKVKTGADNLRRMDRLTRINDLTIENFWKQYDAGAFTKWPLSIGAATVRERFGEDAPLRSRLRFVRWLRPNAITIPPDVNLRQASGTTPERRSELI